MKALKFIGIFLLALLIIFIIKGIFFGIFMFVWVLKAIGTAAIVAGLVYLYFKAKKEL